MQEFIQIWGNKNRIIHEIGKWLLRTMIVSCLFKNFRATRAPSRGLVINEFIFLLIIFCFLLIRFTITYNIAIQEFILGVQIFILNWIESILMFAWSWTIGAYWGGDERKIRRWRFHTFWIWPGLHIQKSSSHNFIVQNTKELMTIHL